MKQGNLSTKGLPEKKRFPIINDQFGILLLQVSEFCFSRVSLLHEPNKNNPSSINRPIISLVFCYFYFDFAAYWLTACFRH